MAEELTSTKEKILFDTNQLVIYLNTQVAVLNNTVTGMVNKLDEFIKLENERNERVDERLIIQRTDITRMQAQLDNMREHVDKMDAQWKRADIAILLGAILAGVIAWFK